MDGVLRPIQLPADGLVLNAKLAEILAARTGDTLTVEVLEGTRPVREVLVMDVVEEPVGLGAYMDIAALHRLMRGGYDFRCVPELIPCSLQDCIRC